MKTTMAELTVLMVAEKPSLALAIATHLCGGVEVHTRSNGATPVHEFPGRFRGRACRFRVTAVKGHVYSLDFLPEFQSWEDCEPAELFDAGTLKSPTSGAVAGHVQREARGCSHLVLWLDCDREGENICFEVMHLAVPSLSSAGGRQVWRALLGGEQVAVRRAMERSPSRTRRRRRRSTRGRARPGGRRVHRTDAPLPRAPPGSTARRSRTARAAPTLGSSSSATSRSCRLCPTRSGRSARAARGRRRARRRAV